MWVKVGAELRGPIRIKRLLEERDEFLETLLTLSSGAIH